MTALVVNYFEDVGTLKQKIHDKEGILVDK